MFAQKKKKSSDLLLCYRYYCISQEGAKPCCSNKQPPILSGLNQQSSLGCSCYNTFILAWQKALLITVTQVCKSVMPLEHRPCQGQRERGQTRSNIHTTLPTTQNYRAPLNHQEVRKYISTTYLERKENQILHICSSRMITKHWWYRDKY